jgi:hypothetical protein
MSLLPLLMTTFSKNVSGYAPCELLLPIIFQIYSLGQKAWGMMFEPFSTSSLPSDPVI